MIEPTAPDARAFVDRSTFQWHQRFELAPGVWAPGVSDVGQLLDAARPPAELSGVRALDIGTANAGVALELERRGAAVTAVDIAPPDLHGVNEIRRLFDARFDFVRASLYELPARVDGQYQAVACFGVLYHLRHPLLGLDALRAVTADGGVVWLETEIADARTSRGVLAPVVEFFRWSALGGDGSNWFVPSLEALRDWCHSAGFEVEAEVCWPDAAPTRALLTLRARPGPPEYRLCSYEVPLTVATGEPLPRWDETFTVPAEPPA